jgi:hypothetical protein
MKILERSSLDGVIRIVFWCTYVEMIRIHTEWIIASMAH